MNKHKHLKMNFIPALKIHYFILILFDFSSLFETENNISIRSNKDSQLIISIRSWSSTPNIQTKPSPTKNNLKP